MADAAVTFLLENVTQLLKSYVELISGADHELEQLKQDLELLNGYLEKAEDIKNKDPALMAVERQISEAVHDAEDTIDKCLTTLSLESPKLKPFGYCCKCHDLKHTVNLAEEVKSVRENKIRPQLEEARKHFGTADNGSSKGVEEGRISKEKDQSFLEDIVGFKEQENIIIDCLTEEKEKLDVISIIGMPGSGKTALARKILENGKIKEKFPKRIWVYVSQEFDQKRVFLDILNGLDEKNISHLRISDLIKILEGHLPNEKFLLVMDDLWKTEDWNLIKRVLPDNNRKSKVLITSRLTDVGALVNTCRKPHKLSLLEDDGSWELLQSRVFQKPGDCPQELQCIGRAIASKCHGLPLSLVVIGGILKKEYSSEPATPAVCSAWEKVLKSMNDHGGNNEQNPLIHAVALSYKDLPHSLRNCFLYLGLFPEDYEIPVWTLTRLWIAEGFVQLKSGQQRSLEEIADKNLKDLINRNLVMVGKTSPTGEVKTCQVHDAIREFCKSKASFEDRNLFLQIQKSDGVFKALALGIKKFRRLCINSYVNDFLKEIQNKNLKAPQVRSFLCFSKDPNVAFDPQYLSAIPDAFELLRVFDSKSMKFTPHLPDITKLIHLRYATLSGNNLDVLTKGLSSLWNLQTLVVDTDSPILQIRTNIWKMIQLRHLKTKSEIILELQEEGTGCEYLQTLTRLSPKCCTTDVFKKAPNVRRLGIRGDLSILKTGECFQDLRSVETLKLKHSLAYSAASEKPLHRLPDKFPPHIKRLTLSNTCLEWNYMSTLAMIGTLEVLKLKDNAFMGILWAVAAGFHNLQFLLIENTNLVIWEASISNPFPRLWCLVLKNCLKLSKIPEGLAKSLNEFKTENVPQLKTENVPQSVVPPSELRTGTKASNSGWNRTRYWPWMRDITS